MLKKIVATVVAVAAVALLHTAALAGGLSVGDPAPKMTVKEFVKGAPVTKFEKGKLYVVEFWATWCGPCKESIPHLTEMAKKNKNVTFVGVSVWEQDQSKVVPFVKQMGDKMDYHVAMDAVPAGATGNEGAMATTWMKAAEQNGIPTAFIVNKESKVAWIGHPMAMEEPLSKIVAGKWDIQVEAEKSRKAVAAAHKMQELQQKVVPLYRAEKYSDAIALLDDATTSDPDMEQATAPMKMAILARQGKVEEEAAYLTKLIGTIYKDDMMTLNQVAWPVVDPDAKQKAAPPMAAAALKAALRADELAASKDPAIADTLAAAYFANGDTAKAVETQERAVKLIKGTAAEKDASYTQHLTKYKSAK